MLDVAVFGAGGKMGARVIDRLSQEPDLRLLAVEPSPEGRARIERDGLAFASLEEAARTADAAVLAVPDTLIGPITHEFVPLLRPGALVIGLDAAAAYAGRLPDRKDVAHFICHPSHPPLYTDETDIEALRDYFGAVKGRQSIVNALVQGSDEDYALGERLARKMFAPILRSHRVTLEQMAFLEPVLSETVLGGCLTVIREAMDEAIKLGVPAEAARDFVLGHLNAEGAIIFDVVPWSLSDGALLVIDDSMETVFRPDWRRVFDRDEVLKSTERITALPDEPVSAASE